MEMSGTIRNLRTVPPRVVGERSKVLGATPEVVQCSHVEDGYSLLGINTFRAGEDDLVRRGAQAKHGRVVSDRDILCNRSFVRPQR